jgi:hypothetical protein
MAPVTILVDPMVPKAVSISHTKDMACRLQLLTNMLPHQLQVALELLLYMVVTVHWVEACLNMAVLVQLNHPRLPSLLEEVLPLEEPTMHSAVDHRTKAKISSITVHNKERNLALVMT